MYAETENYSPVSGSPHIEKFATTTAVMIADCPGRMDKIATCSKREPQGKSKGLPALPQPGGRHMVCPLLRVLVMARSCAPDGVGGDL